MVPSLYRVLKKELGEKDILESMRFNTQLLDLFEGFQPKGGSPCPPLTHIKCILTGLFVPAKGLADAFKACYPDSKVFPPLVATVGQILYICWCALHIVEVEKEGMHTIAWLCFTGFFLLVAFARGELRRKYNIWGFALEDLFCAIAMYPFVLAQMASNNAKSVWASAKAASRLSPATSWRTAFSCLTTASQRITL